ncbi:MAG TPA: class I SAM-dependent methyltransferase [Steroidobacteraceae bacterium]|nr:class I SAM-dependent methyltransferase [Steroidobacteraceae bacterium]
MAGLASALRSLLGPEFWRQKLANWRARRFDRRYQIETSSVVPVAAMNDVAEDLARHAVHYEPTTLPKFERAMRALAIDPSRFTFVDYGSGKGRVLLLAARHPFRRVVGVEMSAALHEVAAANVEAFGRGCRLAAPIELHCGDARDFPVPEGNLVAYFYNPFDESVLAEVWGKLHESLRQAPRSLVVIYVNPAHRQVFDGARVLERVFDDGAVTVYRSSS